MSRLEQLIENYRQKQARLPRYSSDWYDLQRLIAAGVRLWRETNTLRSV